MKLADSRVPVHPRPNGAAETASLFEKPRDQSHNCADRINTAVLFSPPDAIDDRSAAFIKKKKTRRLGPRDFHISLIIPVGSPLASAGGGRSR